MAKKIFNLPCCNESNGPTPEDILIGTIASFLFVSNCPPEMVDECFAIAKKEYLDLRKAIGKD